MNEELNPTPENMEQEKPESSANSPEKVEQEWADALHLDSWPPETAEPIAGSQLPPEIPSDAFPEIPSDSIPQIPAPAPIPNPAPVSPVAANATTEPMPDTYLVWSVLATLMCCLPVGIIAILYSTKVSTRYYARDIEGAKRASEKAQYWIIGSIVLGLVMQTVYLPLMLLF